MQRDNTLDPIKAKKIARQKYTQRQIDKWIRWSWEVKEKIKWRELIEMQDKYNIKVE